jgi:sec-independent protein translocase protein TatA
MLRNIGGPELLVILVVVLLFFGASRLPGLARSLGESARAFRQGLEDGTSEEEEASEDSDVS